MRSLRRWLIVAGVWAVAASAIAVIALLKANDATKVKDTPAAVTGSQLSGVQRGLDKRIDALEKQIKTLPTSSDVSKLDDRLKAVEKKSDSTASDLKAERKDVDALKKRVDDVEQKQQQAGAGNGGTGTDTNTTTTP